MPRESTPQLSNAHQQEVDAGSGPAGSTPEAEVTSGVPNFRKELMKDSKFEVLMGMGEGAYQQMMESGFATRFGEPSGRADGRDVLADAALPADP